ncbi:uncharacterized protein [Malus domestica]|uniref:uncharacterized protein n=1 Tax=Malus domestica TaxID=3750 RepID=UPI00397548F1
MEERGIGRDKYTYGIQLNACAAASDLEGIDKVMAEWDYGIGIVMSMQQMLPPGGPLSTVSTFKVLSTKCLQKVRIGEQISLVRMKIPWPLSPREAALHYFMFEYFQDDLIVVLLKSVGNRNSLLASIVVPSPMSDLRLGKESIDGTHCPTNEATAGAKDAVMIDLVGGFALQKVTNERSYGTTIASMDIKMDFVPPSLINFISRQLIGGGFKLYQKVICFVFKCKTIQLKIRHMEQSIYSEIFRKGRGG